MLYLSISSSSWMGTTNCSFASLLMNPWISRQPRILADLTASITSADRPPTSCWKVCQNVSCRVSWSLYCLQPLFRCSVPEKSCSVYRFCPNGQIVASAQSITPVSRPETCWTIMLQKLKSACDRMNGRREKIDDIESRDFCMIGWNLDGRW